MERFEFSVPNPVFAVTSLRQSSNPFRRFLKAAYMSTDEVCFSIFCAIPYGFGLLTCLYLTPLQFVDIAGGDALNYLR